MVFVGSVFHSVPAALAAQMLLESRSLMRAGQAGVHAIIISSNRCHRFVHFTVGVCPPLRSLFEEHVARVSLTCRK